MFKRKHPVSAEDLRIEVDAIQTHLRVFRGEIAALRDHVDMLKNEIINGFRKELSSTIKTLSSIELELLMARDACLDNNFDGKQDL